MIGAKKGEITRHRTPGENLRTIDRGTFRPKVPQKGATPNPLVPFHSPNLKADPLLNGPVENPETKKTTITNRTDRKTASPPVIVLRDA